MSTRLVYRLLGLALVPLCAAAQPIAVADSAIAARTDSLRPGAALLRSALLPGWGQFYNGKPYKALLFAGTSAALFSLAAAEHAALGNARNAQEHEDRIARRNTRILFFAISATLAGIDAYVDAHLDDFADAWNVRAGPDGSSITLSIDLPSKER